MISRRDGETHPGFWIGHQSESQYETDAEGRFVLANVPSGTYQLDVRPPRVPGEFSSFVTQVSATAGDHDVKVVLATGLPQPTPRLQPRRIQKLAPATP